MMPKETVQLSELAAIVGGGTPTRSNTEFYDGTIPWVTPKDMKTWEIRDAQVRITQAGLDNSAARLIPPDSVLVVVRSGVLKHTIPIALNRVPVAINQDMKALQCRKNVHPDFLAHFLKARSPEILQWVRATTADNFPIDRLKELHVPLPPLSEQQRIADILDRTDALRAKRRATLAQRDTLTQSIFVDMFGDPAANPKAWPCEPLGALSSKFSDGPFGSNLKSEHYTDHGVRVIRLQNIGVGEFLDEDKAYISTRHFESLRKHECQPGDVLVGTLGDPNLRACILPKALPFALNKADCVQMRVNDRVNAEYVSALLNNPSTAKMAQSLMLGQTRVRISMGRLRELVVPVPPRHLQDKFARTIDGVQRIKDAQLRAMESTRELFAALQYRAFSGEL